MADRTLQRHRTRWHEHHRLMEASCSYPFLRSHMTPKKSPTPAPKSPESTERTPATIVDVSLPLHYAAMRASLPLFNLLLNHADAPGADKEGMAPIHLCWEANRSVAIFSNRLLLLHLDCRRVGSLIKPLGTAPRSGCGGGLGHCPLGYSPRILDSKFQPPTNRRRPPGT